MMVFRYLGWNIKQNTDYSSDIDQKGNINAIQPTILTGHRTESNVAKDPWQAMDWVNTTISLDSQTVPLTWQD